MKKELEIFNEIAEALLAMEEADPVVKLGAPEEMVEQFNLSLQDQPMADGEFRTMLEKIVLNTPRTASRSFFNQLFGGRVDTATLGELLTVMLNISMYTYKVGGPHVGIEKEVIQQVCSRIGYDPETSAGTFAPGGSMSNFMAMIMARDKLDKEAKYHGITKQMVVYTSDEAHYSISKNASFSGVGRENVRFIVANPDGSLDTLALEKMIITDRENGLHPFLINATAGTTVMGAFDSLEIIAQIAKRQNVWFHIDGAYGGCAIFSEKYKHLLNGIENSDSFTMNPHKSLGTPLSCSVFVTKHKQQLVESFSQDASYLYQGDSDDYNLGKTSIQCGRRNDAFKFWTLWKSVGTKGLGDIIDRLFELADIARDYISEHPDYTLYSYKHSTSVCFNYKDIPADDICNALAQHGELMVGHGCFKDETFVRFVTVNSKITKSDILSFFQKFENFAEKLIAE